MNNSLNSSKIEHYHNPYEIATQQNMEVQFNEDDEFAAIEERINQLNGIEVFQIFNEEENYKELVDNSLHFQETMKNFELRLIYLLGSIILHNQKYLVNEKCLQNSIRIESTDAIFISCKIIEKAKMFKEDQELKKMKKNMQLIYKYDANDYEVASSFFSFCMKVWYEPMKYELQLNYQTIEETMQKLKKGAQLNNQRNPNAQEKINGTLGEIMKIDSQIPYKNPNPNPRAGPFQVLRMPAKLANNQQMFTPQNNQKSTNSSINSMKGSTQNANNVEKNGINNKKILSNNVKQEQKRFNIKKPRSKQSIENSLQKQSATKQDKNQPINLSQTKPNNLIISQANQYISPGNDDQKIILTNNSQARRTQSNLNRTNPNIKKWRPEQEADFCKFYSEAQNSDQCRLMMQTKYGLDARWKISQQIDIKIQTLSVKVFSKFDSLQSTNQNIQNFRKNKVIVLSNDSSIPPHMRRTLLKHISTIYEAMLNVSQEKKATISQKIVQVNNICKQYTKAE